MNAIRVQLEVVTVYGYGSSYNRLPLIHRILIENPGETLEGLTVTIRVSPAFFVEKKIPLGKLEEKSAYAVCTPELSFDSTYLAYLKEPVPATVFVSLEKDGQIVAEGKRGMTLITADGWSGSETLPELLSVLVSPAQPEIDKIASAASQVLITRGIFRKREYGNHSPKSIMTMMECLYHTLRTLRLSYAMQAPDYSQKGLKLKFPEGVIHTRSGNSLEIALLYASLLEAMGCHPVIALFGSQALVGCFIRELCYPSPVVDTYETLFLPDPITPKKEAVCWIDSGSFAYGTAISFADAVRNAKNIMNDHTEHFVMAVDIRRARRCGLSPLPNRVSEGEGFYFEHTDCRTSGTLPGYDDLILDTEGDAFDRTAATFRKLLASQENEILLLTHKGGNGISLIDSQPARILSILGKSKKVRIAATPYQFSVEGRTPEDLALIGSQLSAGMEDNEDAPPCLYTFFKERELCEHVSPLARRASNRAATKGISGLCIGFGLIRFRETSLDEYRYGPAILLPVKMIKCHESNQFYITSAGEEPLYHEGLLEKMERLFGIRPQGLPPLWGTKAADVIPAALKQMEAAFSLCASVTMYQGACLGIFAWDDMKMLSLLHPAALRAHPVTAGLITKKFPQTQTTDFHPPAVSLLPMDGKQREGFDAALMHPISLIEGEEGSGKTRVAENLIFHLMASGKRVLYAAGSHYAMNDLYARLKNLGLEESIFAFGEQSEGVVPSFPLSEEGDPKTEPPLHILLSDITKLKKELDAYYYALKKVQLFGFSFNRALQEYERCRHAKAVPFTPLELSGLYKKEFAARFDMAATLFCCGKACGEPYNNPLRYVKALTCSPYDLRRVPLMLTDALSHYDHFTTFIDSLCRTLHIEEIPSTPTSVNSLFTFVRQLASNHMSMVKTFLAYPGWKEQEDALSASLQSAMDALELREELSLMFEDDVYTLPIMQMQYDWQTSEELPFFKKKAVRRTILDALHLASKDIFDCRKCQIDAVLNRLAEYTQHLQRANESFPLLMNLFHFTEAGLDELPSDTIKQLYAAVNVCIDYRSRVSANRELAAVANALPDSPSHLVDELSQAEDAYKTWLDLVNTLASLLHIDFAPYEKTADKPFLRRMDILLETQRGVESLPQWCLWLTARDQAIKMGLGKVVSLYENNPVTAEEMEASFIKGFFEAACRSISITEDALKDFDPAVYLQKVQHLKKLEKTYREQSVLAFCSAHANICASFHREHLRSSPQYARCLESNGKMNGMKLYASLPHAANARFPCVLACHASLLRQVCDKPNFWNFDYVILDDAHLIPSHTACALTMLGDRAVVLSSRTAVHHHGGISRPYAEDSHLVSPRQEEIQSLYAVLRPVCPVRTVLTENYTSPGRMHAILSSLTSPIPSKPLLPAPTPVDFRDVVHVVVTGGHCDENDVNVTEARWIAQTIFTMAKECVQHPETFSVGVFTMHARQQRCIEQHLSRLMMEKPDIASVLEQASEPLYISALPSAVYMPRDHILFSPVFTLESQSGTLPRRAVLSMPDGETRLAMMRTSVKKQLTVITSFAPEELILCPTLQDGYGAFQHFFKALESKTVYRPALVETETSTDEVVRQKICTFLHQKGYMTRCPLYTSLDIGVMHPDKPDTCLMGILLDDTALRFSSDAFSREVLLQDNLEKSGWKICRVYAPAWFKDSDSCMEEILSKLEEAKGILLQTDAYNAV